MKYDGGGTGWILLATLLKSPFRLTPMTLRLALIVVKCVLYLAWFHGGARARNEMRESEEKDRALPSARDVCFIIRAECSQGMSGRSDPQLVHFLESRERLCVGTRAVISYAPYKNKLIYLHNLIKKLCIYATTVDHENWMCKQSALSSTKCRLFMEKCTQRSSRTAAMSNMLMSNNMRGWY